LTIGKSNSFLWVMAIASVGMAVGGLFLVLQGESLAGWPALVFFSACAVSIGYQAIQRGPRVVIDQVGILDRTLGIGIIPWSEIQGAFVKRVSTARFVCLELRDPEPFRARLSPLKRRLIQVNRKLGYTDFSVNLTGTDADPDAVCELILKEVQLHRQGAA
jgi:hypothetical protein